MSKTHIEWTEHTWNPIISGCSIISEGCTNCYAMKMAHRHGSNPNLGQKYVGLTRKTAKGNVIWNGKVNIDMNDKALYEPLQRKKPTMYFVNSMTDLFHEGVPFEAIDKIMAVIALCTQHTFQVLTKRPERMKEYFDRNKNNILDNIRLISDVQKCDALFTYKMAHLLNKRFFKEPITESVFPFQNLWLGVSVENEKNKPRIDILREIPAKVRFLSLEPLLEDLGNINLQGIYWVIVGGESGHNARPMHPNWVRSIKDQCKNANVPFFFKQLSSNNNKDYKNYEKFPKDLQIRELPRS